MKTLKLTIEGMHCNGCKLALERELNDSLLVSETRVSLENKEAYVLVNNDTKFKNIEKIIKRAGFKCTSIEEVINEENNFKY